MLKNDPEKLVEELIALNDESDKTSEDQSEAKRKAVANEMNQALHVTDRALETLGETRKRNEEERAGEKRQLQKKRSGEDMLE